MGAEVGATTSTFPYSDNMRNYLHATGRGPVADAADRAAGAGFLQADQGAEYDEVIEIVSGLLPQVLPPSPLYHAVISTPVSSFGALSESLNLRLLLILRTSLN